MKDGYAGHDHGVEVLIGCWLEERYHLLVWQAVHISELHVSIHR